MGIIIETDILNRSKVEASNMWNRACDTWSELFVASAMSIKDTMEMPMTKVLLSIPGFFRNVMRFTRDGLVVAIDRIFTCNDLFDVTSLNGEPSESICAKLFSEYDAKKVLRGYFKNSGSEEIFDELDCHNRLVLPVNKDALNLTECYLYFTVIDMMPMDNTDPEYVLATIKNPVFYSVLLMALSANHLLIQCDKYPEDPISLCSSIQEMRLLLKIFVGSMYFIPSVFEYLVGDDCVNTMFASI